MPGSLSLGGIGIPFLTFGGPSEIPFSGETELAREKAGAIPSPRSWEGIQDPHLEELECSIWAAVGIQPIPREIHSGNLARRTTGSYWERLSSHLGSSILGTLAPGEELIELVDQPPVKWTPFGLISKLDGKEVEWGAHQCERRTGPSECWRVFCVCGIIVAFTLFVLSLLVFDSPSTMGQGQTTPKSLILSHFSEVKERALNVGLVIKKGKFNTFCSAEWPTFGVGWPIQGSLSLDLITKVKAVIFWPGN
jgi:hypothetical protein